VDRGSLKRGSWPEARKNTAAAISVGVEIRLKTVLAAL
jgi:hypothetical protein